MVISDQRADVTGLLVYAAEAFAAAVPERPADDGYFGPRSVTWRISHDLAGLVAGLRSLVIQALHPLAMAGVDQHSHWRTDPAGRLAATSGYLAAISFGGRDSAEIAAARVRKIHEHIRGFDEVTGLRYCASDPALLLWVHAALVDSALVARAMFGTPLGPADADRYVAEMVIAAELVGVPRELVPASVAQLAAYTESMRPQLCCTRAARESIDFLLDLPEHDVEVAGIWQDVRDAVLISMPDWAARLYGYPPPPPLPPGRRDQIRQALGVLDLVFMTAPGVLEARQRITLRIRAAQRD